MAPLLSNFRSRQPLFSKSESGTASHFRNPSPPLVSGLPGRTRLPMPSHSRLTPSPLHYFKVRRERSSLSSALRTAKTASIHSLPAFDHSEVNIKNSCGECVECGGCNDIPARFRQSKAHEDSSTKVRAQVGTGRRDKEQFVTSTLAPRRTRHFAATAYHLAEGPSHAGNWPSG